MNDNAMSINHRVGGMAEHLARISANDAYQDIKRRMKGILSETPGGKMVEEALGRWKSKLKSLLLPPNIFEEMDITYWGPFDGHNVEEMDRIFHLAKAYPESLLIHVVTKKGKGYGNVESSPTRFHGVSPRGPHRGPCLPVMSRTGAPPWRPPSGTWAGRTGPWCAPPPP